MQAQCPEQEEGEAGKQGDGAEWDKGEVAIDASGQQQPATQDPSGSQTDEAQAMVSAAAGCCLHMQQALESNQ